MGFSKVVESFQI